MVDWECKDWDDDELRRTCKHKVSNKEIDLYSDGKAIVTNPMSILFREGECKKHSATKNYLCKSSHILV